MRTIGEHLGRVREQPHHVRRRFALGSAGALTALIGVVWLGASLATGTFALKGSNFAEVTGAEIPEVAAEGSPESQDTVAGAGVAATAAAAAATAKDEPAHVEVVPSGTGMPTKTPPPPIGPTIIPF